MAACGLITGLKNSTEAADAENESIRIGQYLTTLVNFASAMTRVLRKFNEAGDEYQLRIGQHHLQESFQCFNAMFVN